MTVATNAEHPLLRSLASRLGADAPASVEIVVAHPAGLKLLFEVDAAIAKAWRGSRRELRWLNSGDRQLRLRTFDANGELLQRTTFDLEHGHA